MRLVEYSSSGVNGTWDSSGVCVVLSSWNHTVIQVYSLQASGFVRVSLKLTDAFGAPLNVSSNAIEFTVLSPNITGIFGNVSGVPTTGGNNITIRE